MTRVSSHNFINIAILLGWLSIKEMSNNYRVIHHAQYVNNAKYISTTSLSIY